MIRTVLLIIKVIVAISTNLHKQKPEQTSTNQYKKNTPYFNNNNAIITKNKTVVEIASQTYMWNQNPPTQTQENIYIYIYIYNIYLI